jgi:hypothetical protein
MAWASPLSWAADFPSVCCAQSSLARAERDVLRRGNPEAVAPFEILPGGFCAGSVQEPGIKARKRGKLGGLNLLDLETGAYTVC